MLDRVHKYVADNRVQVFLHAKVFGVNILTHKHFNLLKTSENCKVFRCFQGVKRGALRTNGLKKKHKIIFHIWRQNWKIIKCKQFMFHQLVLQCWSCYLFSRKSFSLELFRYDDSFISNNTWLSYFLLIYDSNFVVCTDRARICFKCYVKEKRKCSFENAFVEKSESSINLK